jgi:hypothetical protein
LLDNVVVVGAELATVAVGVVATGIAVVLGVVDAGIVTVPKLVSVGATA